MSDELLEGWHIIEQMGHVRYVGMVREVVIAGAGMLRVDVPELPAERGLPGIRAFTKVINPTSLYAITPISEEEAQVALHRNRSVPHNLPMIAADPWEPGMPYNPYPDHDEYVNDDDRESDDDWDEDDERSAAREPDPPEYREGMGEGSGL